MSARVMTRVAASALVLLFLAGNQLPIQAEPVPMPTSKLLLPYFEVSIDSSYEEVTHFSVSNWSNERVDIKAIVYTNWAIPVLEVPMFLNPRQVRSVDLRSWLLRGKLLANKTVCADGGDDCDEILHLQAALTGRRSPVDRLYYSSETKEGIASGFVILTVMGGAGTHDAIWGEYSYTQPDSRATEGERLVRLTEGSTCGGDLCQRRALRFRERGALDENTKISIWSWNGDEGEPSRTPHPPFDLGHLEIDVYDEQGRLIEVVPQLATLPSQVLDLAEWDLGKPYGWLDLRSSEPSAIAGVYHMADNFGFALSSWCLPCDPCDPEGTCYDPEHATCRKECVAAQIQPIGGSTGIVGEPFDLTLDMVGSEPLAMKVSKLPRGLRLEGYRIFGTPMVPGSFTVEVSNECADDVVKITILEQLSTLTLIKEVINDDGGTAAASDFELFVDHSRVLTGVANEFFAGTYRASERNLPGYQAGTWTGDCAPDGTVVLGSGEHKTCVIVNDDLDAPPPARLTLIKKVLNRYGGNATVADFPLFVESQRVTSGVAIELQPGTYRASEQNRAGYLASAWGRDCAADGRVTLIAGDNKVCEITNSDLPASLTLIKKVVNRYGGTAGVSDFVLLVDSQRVTSGVAVAVAAGSYRASEQNLPGYVAGAWTGHCAADGRVTLALGENKVCEITNSDSPASLTLIKRVINDDGGTAQVADFELSINGLRATSGVPVDLGAGSYRASEQNLPGYEASSWSGDCAADGRVTLALGQHKTCEITNDDRPSSLTLIKRVINDDGGTAVVSDFKLFVDGQQVTSGVAKAVLAGSHHASEQNLPGYQAGVWTGHCASNGSVNIALGEHKVCEITNDDRPSSLTLIKRVINDDGGTAVVSDFKLFVDGQQVTSGVAKAVLAGNHNASEQNLPGYQAGVWTGHCASNGSVNIALGEHKVCEITNDDRPSSLTLIKRVINDDGGTAVVSDFKLFVDGQQVTSGVAKAVLAGNHNASEQNLPGYQAGVWTGHCASNGSVTIALGEHKTCEITNDDRPSSLTLIKRVINNDGGTAVVSDFKLFIDGQQVSSGVAKTVLAGSHRASEQNLPGYQAGAWTGHCAADGSVTIALGEHKVCEITNDDVARPCEEINPPQQFISSGRVESNNPHQSSHWVKVSFDYQIQGAFNGEVQIFWRNGGSTYIKERQTVQRSCQSGQRTGRLEWTSTSQSHHPGHGAEYFARFVSSSGQVLQSIPLN